VQVLNKKNLTPVAVFCFSKKRWAAYALAA